MGEIINKLYTKLSVPSQVSTSSQLYQANVLILIRTLSALHRLGRSTFDGICARMPTLIFALHCDLIMKSEEVFSKHHLAEGG